MIKKTFQFVDGSALVDLMFIKPALLLLFSALVKFCDDKNIPLNITSMIRPIDSISKSDTHQTGRAFDIRIKDLTKNQIQEITRFLKDYDVINKVGAITSSGIRRICVKKSDHIHVQVSRWVGLILDRY